ncbi:MAG: hypothetical protein IJU23_07985 [Proteobacteria bacterium]|nr:hypothetical protein [Pseudomonadota bacterium]
MKNKLYIALFLFLTAIAGLTVMGCVKQTPVPQYSDNVTFSVVYTHDDVTNVTSSAVKDDFAASMNSVITERNLKVSAIDFNAIASELTTIRDTERRLQLLRQYARGSQIILLTEISTEFYSALSGRYRWDVNVHLSIYDMVTRNTLEDKFTVPAVLMYSHENGDDAIMSVETEVQRRMGTLIDTFMKGRTVRESAPQAAPAPAPAPAQAPVVAPEPEPEPAADESDSEENIGETNQRFRDDGMGFDSSL